MHRSTTISHTSIERLTPPFTDRAWFPHHRPSQGNSSNSSSNSNSGGLSDCDELTMVEHRQSLHKASIREKLAPKPFGMQSKSGNATALYGAKPMLYAAADDVGVDGGDYRMEYSSSGRSSSRRQPIRSPPSDITSHHHYGRMNMIGNNYRTSSSFLMEESEASGVLREEEEDEEELYVPSPTRARVGTVDDETAEELVALSMADASSSVMRTELDSDDDNDEGVGVSGRRSGERGDRTSESLIGVSTMDMSASSSFL